MSAASIAAEIEWVGGQPISPQTIRRTLHQIGLHGCHPTRKLLLKMMHKKARKQFVEDKQTKDMDYWNHVLWSDETKINVLVQMVSSVCGGNQVRSTKTSVSCLQSSMVVSVMVWGCMRAAGTEELQFIEGTMNDNMYCGTLKQSMIPSLWRLSRRAVFQHDNDHCLAKEAEGRDDGLAKHVSRPKPY